MTDQTYESYWKLTLAYSDITGDGFNGSLGIIVNFIDDNRQEISSNAGNAYDKLQHELVKNYPIQLISTRKAINQFIKLGFVNSALAGYHKHTKDFLSTSDPSEKGTIFSKIVYSNSSFGRSFTNDSDVNEINFFVNTLTAADGRLTKEEAVALMTINVSLAKQDFATREMIDSGVTYIRSIGFVERKYNQIRYLWNLLDQLDDLAVRQDAVYFSSDSRSKSILTDGKSVSGLRDSYLQRLYKNQLISESNKYYDAVVCMVEKLDYPVLIASHIKPYSHSTEEEAFDENNGLLLSRNIDQLFDQGYISFSDDGTIVISQTRNLSKRLKDHLSVYRIDEFLLNQERKNYLQYHRDKVFTD